MNVEAKKPGPTPAEREEFGRRLRAARRAKGLTQEQLAALVGVGANIPTTWEKGHSTPNGRVPWLLCRVLGYETWVTLWGDEPTVTGEGQRLISEREVDERAQRLARELLAETIRRLGQGDAASVNGAPEGH